MLSSNIQPSAPPTSLAIVLNGQPEACSRLKKYWDNYRHIIVCDGAWQKVTDLLETTYSLNTHHLTSHKIILLGDGDSLKNKPNNFVQINDEHSTDFEKSIQWALENEPFELTKRSNKQLEADVYFANGGELDHTLGNLAIASKYASQITCHFYTDKQYYRFVENDFTLTNAHNKVVSIFPYPNFLVTKSTGFKYPMQDYAMQVNTQQSLRNTIIADKASITGVGAAFVFVEC